MTEPYRQLSNIEKHRAALPVLVAARKSVVAGGEPIDAIQQAGNAEIECWFARNILLATVPSVSLQAWWLDRSVKQSDRTRAFDRAIRVARRAFGHKGGWVVTDVRGAA